MNDAPLVSIITAVYKNVEQIEETLRSVQAQTYKNYEHIVVDDHGGDGAIDVVREIMKNDPRIQLYHNPKNMGISYTLNHAIKYARGKYIAVMDADDLWTQDKLERQVNMMEANPELGILGSSAYHIDAESVLGDPHRMAVQDLQIRFNMLLGPSFYHAACLYRASVIREHNLQYNTEFKSGVDHDFWCRMLKHCKARNFSTPRFFYRMFGESMSKRTRPLIIEENKRKSMELIRALGGISKENLDRIEESVLRVLWGQPFSWKDLNQWAETLNLIIPRFLHAQGLDYLPMSLRSLVGKWIIKSILTNPSPVFRVRALAKAAVTPSWHFWPGAAGLVHLAIWRFRCSLRRPVVTRIRTDITARAAEAAKQAQAQQAA